jgi:histone deacetylase HOS3
MQFAPEIPDSQDPDSVPSNEVSKYQTAPSTPQQLPPHLPNHLQQASQVPLPASSPIQPTLPAPSSLPTSSSDVFIPYQPEGPPPNAVPQQEEIKWLPPNTSTPTPMKRGNLPVFTSTSTIPFGINPHQQLQAPAPLEPAQAPAAATTSSKPFDASIWEVPETPKK